MIAYTGSTYHLFTSWSILYFDCLSLILNNLSNEFHCFPFSSGVGLELYSKERWDTMVGFIAHVTIGLNTCLPICIWRDETCFLLWLKYTPDTGLPLHSCFKSILIQMTMDYLKHFWRLSLLFTDNLCSGHLLFIFLHNDGWRLVNFWGDHYHTTNNNDNNVDDNDHNIRFISHVTSERLPFYNRDKKVVQFGCLGNK